MVGPSPLLTPAPHADRESAGRRALRLAAIGGICLAVVCTAWLAPVSYFYSSSQRASEVRQIARRVRFHELEARRAEKDFLLRSLRSDEFLETGLAPYLALHAEAMAALRGDVDRLGELLPEPQRRKALLLSESVETYGACFGELVERLRSAGQAERRLRHEWRQLMRSVALERADAPLAAVAQAAVWLEGNASLRPWLGAEDDALAGADLRRGAAAPEGEALPLLEEAGIAETQRELTDLYQRIGVDRTLGIQGALRDSIHAIEPVVNDIVAQAEAAADAADALLIGGLVVACGGMGVLLTWVFLQGKLARSRASELARLNLQLARDMEAREVAERELKSILECAPEALLLVDEDGRIVLANAQASELFGRAIDDFMGREMESLVPGLDPRLAIPAGGPRRAEGRRSNGETLPLELSSSRFATSRGWFTFHALRDLTHQLATLEQLARKHEQLLQAERLAAIGQMAAGIAHESGNALQRSQACLDLLARRVTELPKAAELVARIQEAQDHLQRLHGEVREFAAPIRVQPQPCDLARVVDRAWESLALNREGRQATMVQESSVTSLECRVDAFALEQVFRNLLKNALEATTGDARILVAWTQETHDGKSWLRAAVRDNGRGLTTEARQRIFQPFFTTKTRGTGLGLAIARRLVEAHGGTIEPSDVAGPGAEIIVRLPKTGDPT